MEPNKFDSIRIKEGGVLGKYVDMWSSDEDLQTVVNLRVESRLYTFSNLCPNTWCDDEWAWVIYKNDELVGLVQCIRHHYENLTKELNFLHTVYFKPEHQRRGMLSTLLPHLKEQLEEVFVLSPQPHMINFMKKHNIVCPLTKYRT